MLWAWLGYGSVLLSQHRLLVGEGCGVVGVLGRLNPILSLHWRGGRRREAIQ